MVSTHISEPTPEEMKKQLKEAALAQASGTPKD
jgi:hypothetical protein